MSKLKPDDQPINGIVKQKMESLFLNDRINPYSEKKSPKQSDICPHGSSRKR